MRQVEDVDKLPELLAGMYDEGEDTGIKVHFGRTKKENSHVSPDWFEPLLAESSGRVTFFDTNTLYGGERGDTESHRKVAHQHGFQPVEILDEKETVQLARHVYVPGRLLEFDQIINAAHFTGHKITGVGGCIKNIGMGMVASRTKLWVHNGGRPNFKTSNCKSCGWCKKHCPTGALGPAGIDQDCNACAKCIGNCEAAYFSFGKHKKVAQRLGFVTRKIVDNLGNIKHIGIAENPTRLCDCQGEGEGEVLVEGFWARAGRNPLEVDKELLRKIQSNIKQSQGKIALELFKAYADLNLNRG